MLKKLTLTCFRKHEDRTFEFAEGLNVFRAANEAGKSSCLEAIAYVMFGSKALSEPLEKVVTWGHKPSELKVVLHFGDYVFSRSKGGAEVTKNGEVICTGQTEVSTYAAELLGADMTLAANLMMASQGKLRGAIEGGPKATATLIEDLAGLDLLDRILDAAAAKLALGSAAPYEARLETVEKYLGNLPAVTAPDEAAYAIRSENLSRGMAESEMKVTHLKTARDTLATAVVSASANRHTASKLKTDLERCRQQVRDAEADLTAVGGVDTPIDTRDLEQCIAGHAENVKRRAAYEKFVAVDQARARQTRTTVEAWFSALKQARSNVTAKVREVELETTRLRAQLVTAQTCSLCGLDVSQFPETAKKNADLQAQIAEKEAEAAKLSQDLSNAERDIAMLEVESNWEDALDRTLRPITNFLTRDDSVFPVQYTWAGEVPAEIPNVRPDWEGELAQAKANNDAIIKAKGRIESLRTVIARAAEQADKVATDLDGIHAMSDAEFDMLAQQQAAADEAVRLEERVALDFQMQIATLNTGHRQAVELYTRIESQRQQFVEEIATIRGQVKSLEFNNALVKKIRAARPIIGNKLWAMVLASVSQIFSLMRGETSIVTKGEDGFEVNGHSASSLSGSAKDLLGLAVRASLVKTFVPACPFIVLDEPASACDDDRSNMLLGYVAASGFSQTLLVTHDSVSETFAHNVIRF